MHVASLDVADQLFDRDGAQLLRKQIEPQGQNGARLAAIADLTLGPVPEVADECLLDRTGELAIALAITWPIDRLGHLAHQLRAISPVGGADQLSRRRDVIASLSVDRQPVAIVEAATVAPDVIGI